MFEQYTKYERPVYRKQIGDARYTQDLKGSDIPDIAAPSAIWQIITGMLPVFIDEHANLSLGLTTTFDKSHEFAVRFRDGELYEVMMDALGSFKSWLLLITRRRVEKQCRCPYQTAPIRLLKLQNIEVSPSCKFVCIRTTVSQNLRTASKFFVLVLVLD